MKTIVQEVMKSKTEKTKENPLISHRGAQYVPARTSQQNREQNDMVQKIHRPNYQQKNIEKRLSILGSEQKIKQEMPYPLEIKNSKEINERSHTKNFNINQLAKLQSLSLVQGHTSFSNQDGSDTREKNEKSMFIGQTKDGVKAWLFKNLHSSVQNSFQRSIKANSIGVIVSNHCTPGQLFLLNEALRSYPSIKYYMTWEKESKQSFVLELYENDSEIVSKAIKLIFQSLSQNAYKLVKAYKTPSPSPWLIKQLGLKSQVEAVAVVEGLDLYTSILLLDRLLKKSANASFSYTLEKNYLLLYGNYEVISQATEQISKDAERTF